MLKDEYTKPRGPDNTPDAARAAGFCQWLRQLRPHTQTPRPASTTVTIADAIERIGNGPVDWACELGHTMATRIIDEIPELGGGVEQFDTLRMGTESSTIRALLQLSETISDAPAITEEALGGVVEFVRRGISLDRVLRGVRLGHAQMAKAFLAECREFVPAGERPDEMQYISDRLFEYIDEFSGSMASTYISERDRWMASAAAARDEAVRQILDGELIDTAAAQKALNYDVTLENLAVTFWFDSMHNRRDSSELQTVAADVLTGLGAMQRLVIPVGAGRLWAWGNRRHFPARLDFGDTPSTQHDVRIAVGTPAEGLDGFRRTHLEAAAAERVARASDPEKICWATTYADTAILALLTTDLAATRNLVQRELGPLAADTPQAADLRATLLSYFEEESSPFAAARRLHVSRNTVAYRVKRACELLGYDIATRRYELHTALTISDRLAHSVIRPAEPQ